MGIWVMNHLSPNIWTMPKSNVWVVHKMASAVLSQSFSGGVGVETWTPCTGVQYSTVYSVQCTEPVLCPAEAVCRRRREPGTWPWSNRWPGPAPRVSGDSGGRWVVWSCLLGIICIWIICSASLKSTFTFTHRSEQHTQWTWHEKI